MSIKIDEKIVGYAVKKAEAATTASASAEPTAEMSSPIQMNEQVERPEVLVGTTYKIKPPVCEHAMYITINDVILNEGTEHEQQRPYEIFINSKEVNHFQWVIAMTRVLSACFRKGGDITFIVEELKSVYDPNGGFFKKGGTFMPSLVAEIGSIIEKHLTKLGMISVPELGEAAKAVLAEKREQALALEAKQAGSNDEANDYPSTATLCAKCNTKAVVMLDGCNSCLSCGDSKCS